MDNSELFSHQQMKAHLLDQILWLFGNLEINEMTNPLQCISFIVPMLFSLSTQIDFKQTTVYPEHWWT